MPNGRELNLQVTGNTGSDIQMEVQAGGQGAANTAEAWAVGNRGGVPVTSDDPAYNNSAKYWANQAQSAAGDAAKYPKIEGGYWYYWNGTEYVNSGVTATWHIVKTYASTSAMNSDFGGTDTKTGDMVMIVNNVDETTNAQIYIKGNSAWQFMVDLSGATGIRGPQGETGAQGPVGATGAQGPTGPQGPIGATGASPVLTMGTVTTLPAGSDATASLTGTEAAPVLNLGIPKGPSGNESIDDTAGLGDTDLVWSADKSATVVGDLKSALSTGMWGIDANWARGKIVNGAYSGSDYYKVTTQQPVHFNVGDIITIATGYKCSVWIITSNSYFDIGWQTGEYAISVTGDYMLCVTSDPAPGSAITDISLYTSKLKRTDNAQNQLNNILKYIRDKIEPNFDPGKNLFNKSFASSNYLVNHDYGVLVYNASYSASDFIRVYNGETIYKKKCNNWYVALYNLDFSYAGSLANANDVTIPQDGYIRVTVANADIDNAIIARTSALPQASDCKSSMIDRVARKEIEEMKTWSNTIETVASMEEIRDTSSHALGSVDLSGYAFASIRINNSLGVPCTMNLYDDRLEASTNWMMRPDGSFVSVNIPAGSSIITDDDLKELPYLKLFRPIIIASSAPTSGYIIIQIVGRK